MTTKRSDPFATLLRAYRASSGLTYAGLDAELRRALGIKPHPQRVWAWCAGRAKPMRATQVAVVEWVLDRRDGMVLSAQRDAARLTRLGEAFWAGAGAVADQSGSPASSGSGEPSPASIALAAANCPDMAEPPGR